MITQLHVCPAMLCTKAAVRHAHAATDLPIDFLMPTVFVTIAYFMAGLAASAENFVAFLAVVLVTCLLTQAMGLFIGAVAMGHRVAQVSSDPSKFWSSLVIHMFQCASVHSVVNRQI